MILISDGGSTSSTHVLIENGMERKRIITGPINPYHQSTEEIKSSLSSLQETGIAPTEVRYYGAGCKGVLQITKVSQAFKAIFNEADISVHSDLQGSALACCGNDPGFIGILGTGSVLGFYDGREISEVCFSSGYLFGDECSGYHLGQQLLSDYFKEKLPSKLEKVFHLKSNMNKDELLSKIYSAKNIKTTVASYVPFLLEHIKESYVVDLIHSSMNAYLNKISSLNNSSDKINLTGSVAWYFKNIIEESINKHNLQVGLILKDPIDGLVEYHLQN